MEGIKASNVMPRHCCEGGKLAAVLAPLDLPTVTARGVAAKWPPSAESLASSNEPASFAEAATTSSLVFPLGPRTITTRVVPVKWPLSPRSLAAFNEAAGAGSPLSSPGRSAAAIPPAPPDRTVTSEWQAAFTAAQATTTSGVASPLGPPTTTTREVAVKWPLSPRSLAIFDEVAGAGSPVSLGDRSTAMAHTATPGRKSFTKRVPGAVDVADAGSSLAPPGPPTSTTTSGCSAAARRPPRGPAGAEASAELSMEGGRAAAAVDPVVPPEPPTATTTLDCSMVSMPRQQSASSTISSEAFTGVGTPTGAETSRRVSVAERTEAYVAACKSKLDKETVEVPNKGAPPAHSAQQTSPSDPLRTRADAGAPVEAGEAPERALRRLSDVSEQRALKVGLLKLLQVRVAGQDLRPSELPRCASGAPKVVQSNRFLHLLLSNEVEFKSCMEADASAAQSDLRHLSMEQLLSIRSRTLDFATESQSHSARNSFLETVDKHLFNKLARSCLSGGIAPARPEVLHALGVRIALTLGAVELIKDGWSRPISTGCLAELPPVPPCWTIKLNREEWPDESQVAVLDTDELWARPLPGADPDFAKATSGGPLAVPCDRTTGIGRNRMLHWEIAVLDPCTEDVLAELRRNPKEGSARRISGAFAEELAATLAKRSVRPRTS